MQKRIVVPMDGSPLSDRIIGQVRRILVREDVEVQLLHVVERWLEQPVRQQRRREVLDHLAGIRDALVAEGASATVELLEGDPADAIITHAERVGAELIVMSSHGRSGIERWVRGSVAERVVRHSTVPVLVANPSALGRASEEARFARILVPLDGSPVGAAILPIVEELARLYGSEVILLRCDWVMPVVSYPYPVPAPMISPEELAATLEPERSRLEALGIRARVVTRFGPEAWEIVETATREQVDLVAMSTHGRSGLSRWVFGSVAEHVVRHCDRPLLVRRVLPAPGAPAAPAAGGLT